jgi:ATPase subunit of ABC transporter with duplicated ATPase domains
MLTIRNLRKTVGGRTLFENATMQVNYSERIALTPQEFSRREEMRESAV